MENERVMGEYLIDGVAVLYLTEQSWGFRYCCFDCEEGKFYDGRISWEDIDDSPVGNVLSAARILAADEIGLIGERVEGREAILEMWANYKSR